jgi:hemolysin III
MTIDPPRRRTKPLLRGVSHEIAAYLAAPACPALLALAKSAAAQLAAVAFGASLFLLFSMSALYHRPDWSPHTRLVIGRFDHAAISLLVAGTYTPFCLVLGPGTGHRLLAAAWAGAAFGIALAVAWARAPKPLNAAVYVLLGWVCIPMAPGIRAALGDGPLALVLGGGLAYTAGAVIYSIRRPDPFPAVFGYHEIFHLLVVGGAICHFLAVEQAIRALG